MDGQELPLPYETPEAPQGDATQAPLGQPGQQPAQGQSGAIQPTTGGQPVPNLDDDPRFRQWKSQTDSRLAQAEARAQQAEIARRAAEAENQRIRTASMDEPERMAWERNQAIADANAARAEVATVRYEQQLRADVDEMAARLNVPVAQLLQSFTPQDDPHTRWLKAIDLQQRMSQQPQRGGYNAPVQPPPYQQSYQQPYQAPYQQPYQPPYQPSQYQSPAQNPANRVDTGVGSGPNGSRFQGAYDRALENNDISAVMDIEAAAQQAGVAIQRKTGK